MSSKNKEGRIEDFFASSKSYLRKGNLKIIKYPQVPFEY